MNHVRLTIWALVLPLFLSSYLLAEPLLTGLVGDVGHGGHLIISGEGFGSKSTPQPILWETMESGGFQSKWDSTHDLTITGNRSRHSHSNYAATNNFRDNTPDGRFEGPGQTSSQWLVQYWFFLSSNWDWGSTTFNGNKRFLSNVKVFRLWPSGGGSENFVVAATGWDNQMEWAVENVSGDPGGTFFSSMKQRMAPGEWHLFQFEFQENSGLGNSDGRFRVWFDGEKVIERNGIITRDDNSTAKYPFIVGFSNVWEPASGEGDRAPNDFYIDDVYVDSSWARVEVGNNPIYSQCTHREIQIPYSWFGDEINIQAQSGSFQPGDNAYLFVIDSQGEVNQDGYPITWGESVDENQPENPSFPPNSGQVDSSRVQPLVRPASGQQASIPYQMGTPGHVEIILYDRLGREVRVLENSHKESGAYQVEWDGLNNSGSVSASGVYMVVLQLGGSLRREKIVLVK